MEYQNCNIQVTELKIQINTRFNTAHKKIDFFNRKTNFNF